MGASLRTGIASLPADADGVFVFLGDMPRVPAAVLAPMAEALVEGALAAAPVFGAAAAIRCCSTAPSSPQLLALTGDAGARGVLQGLGDLAHRAPTTGCCSMWNPDDHKYRHPGKRDRDAVRCAGLSSGSAPACSAVTDLSEPAASARSSAWTSGPEV